MKWYWVHAYFKTRQEPWGKSQMVNQYLLKDLQFSKPSWTLKLLVVEIKIREKTIPQKLCTFFLLQPDWTRIAKSPISWGTSCRRIVRVVIIPKLRLTRNDAPMASPSVKLWVKSAARFKYPATLISSTWSWSWTTKKKNFLKN